VTDGKCDLPGRDPGAYSQITLAVDLTKRRLVNGISGISQAPLTDFERFLRPGVL
jgi:hypothetical protein